jgi:hypothetical protein
MVGITIKKKAVLQGIFQNKPCQEFISLKRCVQSLIRERIDGQSAAILSLP